MATLVISRPDIFPATTSVAAYVRTVFGVPASGAPYGSSVETAVVQTDGSLTFSALAAGTSYILYAGSPARYLSVNTSETESGGGGTGDVTEAELTSAVSAHSADTTSVHGIADTSVLATADDVASDVTAHNNDETGVHGIPNTQVLVGACIFTGGNWTFDGATISARPTWPGPLIWHLGDASSNSPSAWMLAGDVWYPEQE